MEKGAILFKDLELLAKVGLVRTNLDWETAIAQSAEEKSKVALPCWNFFCFLTKEFLYQIVTVCIKTPKGWLCECILIQVGTPLFS